jgi:hypothetical protein
MDAKTEEKPTGPMSIFACIMAGFEILARYWWPLAIPLLLDLILWLGPQLSIEPLVQAIIDLINRQPAPDSETAYQIAQAVQWLKQVGSQANLLSLLSAVPLLNAPSLLAQHTPGVVSPLGERIVLPVANVLVLVAWGIALAPVGLLTGFAYMNALARGVRLTHPAGEGTLTGNPATPRASEGTDPELLVVGLALNTLLKLIRVLSFAAILFVVGVVFLLVWIVVSGVAAVIADIAGLVISGLIMGMGSFIALHLLFVPHGMLLGERRLLRAIVESVALVRMNFMSVTGLVLLVILIYEGLGYVWSLPPGNSWLLLVGILCNSGVATALIMATFVFYQDRLAQLARASRTKI